MEMVEILRKIGDFPGKTLSSDRFDSYRSVGGNVEISLLSRVLFSYTAAKARLILRR